MNDNLINISASIDADMVIYIPARCLEAYQTTQNWSTYASYMQKEEN